MKDLKHLIYFENLLQEANNELVQQAKAEGEHALGYTCYFVPETLLNLPGCFSSRLRAPNTGSIDVGTYYMSSKICSYTRSILERGIEGGYDYLDALLSSETCQMMHRGHEHFEILGLVKEKNPQFFMSMMDVPFSDEDFAVDHYEEQLRVHVLEPLHEVYGVDVSDDALRKAITLSVRYIGDRWLPDKAIDLVDEAASRVRMQALVQPERVHALETQLAAATAETEHAVRARDFARAAGLRAREQALRAQLDTQRSRWEQENSGPVRAVTGEDVAEIVSLWTGIPVAGITSSESKQLLQMETSLRRRVVGQDEAISAIAKALRRARAGLSDPTRPLGVFMLLGPSGVGKSTVLSALLEKRKNLYFSVSATTRDPRPGELDGIHYHFMDAESFRKWIAMDQFLEYAEYVGNYYGTSWRVIREHLDRGQDVLLDIEVEGASNVKRKADNAVLIFVAPPSFEELSRRLRGRRTENEAVVRARLERAQVELKEIPNYDYLVVNDSVIRAASDIISILNAEDCRVTKQNLKLEVD